ncbi:MAG: ATP-binding protein [Alphaproteobacteria bacterium]|nr:ATP-binding protein [Alphaproteobacteria bacterium]
MNIRLKYLLATAFTIVATVPIIIFGVWVERTALQNEIQTVREKHQLLAENMANVLVHYVHDIESTVVYFSGLSRRSTRDRYASKLAKRLGFRHFWVVTSAGRVVREFRTGEKTPYPLNGAILEALLPAASDGFIYSSVMPDKDGKPTIFVLHKLSPRRIAIAAFHTDVIVQLQKGVSVGNRSHVTIVDGDGNVIAHRDPEVQAQMQNIGAVEPVRQIMDGNSGLTTFLAPAAQEHVISGFTTVPQTGWGVLVAQPFEDLLQSAHEVKSFALFLALCGFAAAAALGWLIAGRVTQPLDAVRLTAGRIASGKLTARVPHLSRFATSDLRKLADDFNEMAQRIQEDQKSLAEALSQAQSADRAKSKFLANMSHELRTPLNAIIGFSETIENEIFGPVRNKRYRAYATDIRQSGKHLLAIINNILDLSKIESGSVDLEDEVIDLRDLLFDATGMVRDQADAVDIDITTTIAGDLPALRGSAVKLRQVFVNLLTNSVKYTPRGGNVTLTASRDQGGGIVVQVTDDGIGMSGAEQTVALIPFGRAGSALSQKADGAGLGLPLAKQLAEIHGGRLVIDSEEGAGTTVTVYLPAARVVAKVA